MAADDVDALVARADVEGLRALASSADARVAKAARKGLHRLRSRGITAATEEARPAQRPPVAVEPAKDEIPSLATSADGSGEHLVWLIRQARGNAEIFQARIHEVHGILEFQTARWSRRQVRKLKEDVLSAFDLPAAEIPGDWAHWLIEEAYERTQAARRAPPAVFVRARADLRAAPRRFEEHPAKAAVEPGADLGDREAAKLFESPCCASWYPEPDQIRRLAMLLEEVETSRLVLDEGQKTDRRHEVVRRLVTEYFTPERRARYVRRFLDAAYIVHLGRGRNAELAPLLRGMADTLADGDREADTHPVAMRLFFRCLRPEKEPDKTEEPSRLVSLAEPGLSSPRPPGKRS